jgi:hypothetical protein
VIAQVAAGAEGRLTDGANMISDTAAKKNNNNKHKLNNPPLNNYGANQGVNTIH